jgi:hypothetical protein
MFRYTDNGERVKIIADRFWGNRYQRAFFDVRVLIQMLAATRIKERLRTFFWF